MTISDADLQRLLIALRAGATISTGGSRAHSTYGFENGTWYREDFDEGAVAYCRIDESDIRQLAIEQPTTMQPLLRVLVWREFQAAFLAGETDLARIRLANWRDRGGDPDQAAILSAVLDGPEAVPCDEVKTLIRARIRDRIAFHLIMDTLGWDLGPANARRGLALADRLLAMSGDDSEPAFELRDRLRSLADTPPAAAAAGASSGTPGLAIRPCRE